MENKLTQNAYKDGLIIPFNTRLGEINKDPQKNLNVANLFTGLTGQGKTFAITQNHIEKLMFGDANVDIVLYTVPLNEILENDKFDECAEEIMKEYKETVKFTDNAKIALKELNKGKKVIFCTTHQGIWTKNAKFGQKLFNYIVENKIKTAVFIDEAHTWTVSHADNYKATTGNSPVNYEAALFKSVSVLAEFTPYIFGITATLNREHLDIIPVIGNMKYKVCNSLPTKESMVWKNAWMNKHIEMDTSNIQGVKDGLHQLMTILKEDELKTGSKKVAMIQVKAKSPAGKFVYDTEVIKEFLKELNEIYNYFPSKDEIFAVMNENGCYTFSSDGNYVEKLDTDADLKECANDVNDPLRVIIVVEKGKAGMNIFPLKVVMSLRDYNSKEDNFGFITEFPIQIMGRAVRLYAGVNEDDFKSVSPNYDMQEYIQSGSISVENAKILNSIVVFTPMSSGVWNTAVKEFEQKYVTNVEDVIFDEGDDHFDPDYKHEQDLCTHCGGTGYEPKKDIVEDTNYDNLNNIFKLGA